MQSAEAKRISALEQKTKPSASGRIQGAHCEDKHIELGKIERIQRTEQSEAIKQAGRDGFPRPSVFFVFLFSVRSEMLDKHHDL